MQPGDLVTLPDGRQAYFQRRDKDGNAIVVVYLSLPAKDVKKAK